MGRIPRWFPPDGIEAGRRGLIKREGERDARVKNITLYSDKRVARNLWARARAPVYLLVDITV